MKNEEGYAICFNKWLFDKQIKNELRLLLLISSYSASPEGCFATNKHFADKLGEHEITISDKISKLEKLGYITIEFEKKGSVVIKRKIWITDLKKINNDNEGSNNSTVSQNTNGTVSQNTNGTVSQNTKDNNTSINNTSINNTVDDDFEEKKVKKINKNSEFCKNIAEGIKSLVENKKKVKVNQRQLDNWSKDIERLLKDIEIRGEDKAKEDIIKALQYLLDNDGQYIPVVESGSSFREKFIKIEASRKRNMSMWEQCINNELF